MSFPRKWESRKIEQKTGFLLEFILAKVGAGMTTFFHGDEIMKTAKLFKNGQSQAVRLPKEFRFEGDHVFIKKEGNTAILIP